MSGKYVVFQWLLLKICFPPPPVPLAYFSSADSRCLDSLLPLSLRTHSAQLCLFFSVATPSARAFVGQQPNNSQPSALQPLQFRFQYGITHISRKSRVIVWFYSILAHTLDIQSFWFQLLNIMNFDKSDNRTVLFRWLINEQSAGRTTFLSSCWRKNKKGMIVKQHPGKWCVAPIVKCYL